MQGLELTYETLATTRNEAAVDVLIAALDDPNAANRRRALGALLRRTEPRSSQQVLENWDALKAQEPSKQHRTSVLDGVPRSLPALLRADKIAKKAAKVGFDWSQAEHVWAKVHEELDELKEALDDGDMAAAQDELGDALFALVNLGRKAGLSSDEALTGTIERFYSRFTHMERSAEVPLEDLTAQRWEALWQNAKAEERNSGQ